MNTPGYEEENKTKPLSCRRIEDGETVYEVDVIADAIFDSILRGEGQCGCGDFGIWLLIKGVDDG